MEIIDKREPIDDWHVGDIVNYAFEEGDNYFSMIIKQADGCYSLLDLDNSDCSCGKISLIARDATSPNGVIKNLNEDGDALFIHKVNAKLIIE